MWSSSAAELRRSGEKANAVDENKGAGEERAKLLSKVNVVHRHWTWKFHITYTTDQPNCAILTFTCVNIYYIYIILIRKVINFHLVEIKTN